MEGEPHAPTGDTRFPWDFFALAFAFTWTCWGGAYLAMRGRTGATGGTENLLAEAPPVVLILVLLGVFGPFVSAFVLTWRRDGRPGLARLWKSGWRFNLPVTWLLVAVLLFPAIRVVSLIVGGGGVSLAAFTSPLTLLGMAVFHYFLGGPFGEEFGWRGYALPRLLSRSSALNASLILGVFWILWHGPLFFIPGSPQAQIPFWPWAVDVLTLAVLYTWVYQHVGGVVSAALILHWMGNFSRDLFRPVREVPVSWTGPEGIAVLVKIGLVLVIVAVWGPGHLRRDTTRTRELTP